MQRIKFILILALLFAVPQAYAGKIEGKPIEADCSLLTTGNLCPLYFSMQDSADKVYYCKADEHSISVRLRFKLKIWILTAKALNENIIVEYSVKENEDNEEILVIDRITILGKRYPY